MVVLKTSSLGLSPGRSPRHALHPQVLRDPRHLLVVPGAPQPSGGEERHRSHLAHGWRHFFIPTPVDRDSCTRVYTVDLQRLPPPHSWTFGSSFDSMMTELSVPAV
jgi:hypothetical protein